MGQSDNTHAPDGSAGIAHGVVVSDRGKFRVVAADLFHGGLIVAFSDGTEALLPASALRECAAREDAFLDQQSDASEEEAPAE